MDNEKQFLEKLDGIKVFAKLKNYRLTTQEVEAYFAGSSLTKEQIELVYDYLLAQKITVVGYTKVGKQGENTAETSGLTADEENYFKEYNNDLSALKREEPGEKTNLFSQAAAGDEAAKSRLVELYLPTVRDISMELHDGSVFLGDMVQEGNVSLLLALELLAVNGVEEDIDAFLRNEIRQGIQVMMEEQTELKRRDKRMEQQVNDLDDTLHHLAEEKGRAITIDELAEYMQISEEAVLDIMKLAGEDLYDKYKDSGK